MNAPMPAVSVVIPVYNCERYLRQTLDSVLAQDFRDFEIVVVDDGSTDASRRIVEEYMTREPQRIRLIPLQNGGVCIARNTGLRESRGRYVAMLDHDDYWYPNKLSSQLEVFRADPELGMVFTEDKRWLPDAHGRFAEPDTFADLSAPQGIDPDFSGWVYHKLLLECFVLTSTALIAREVYDSVGAFDESLPYSEDWELFIRISRKYRFAKLRQVSTLYRQHALQGSKVARDVDYATRLIERSLDTWGPVGPDGSRVDPVALRRTLARLSYWHGMLHLRGGSVATARAALARAVRLQPMTGRYLIGFARSCLAPAIPLRGA